MYVGDNPRKDFISLRASGAITVGVQDGPYSKDRLHSKFQPEFKIQTFIDLPHLLRKNGWI
jgi:FMN phosphatase YigB (HAD superfamily)